MKHTKVKTVIKTEEFLEYVQCDICGRQAKDHCNWGGKPYGIDETTLYYREGHAYPDSRSMFEIEVDLCPECFMKKLVPWLELQGVTIKKEYKEW